MRPAWTIAPTTNLWQNTGLRNINRIEKGVESNDFKVDAIDIIGSQWIFKENKYHILTCVLNNCDIIIDKEKRGLNYTETLLIPASINQYEIK